MEPSTSDPGNSTLVTLQPFIHQVGGHSSIQQFDQYTVCKPLFSKELRFYEEVCPAFEPFIPKFKGKLVIINLFIFNESWCWAVVMPMSMNQNAVKLFLTKFILKDFVIMIKNVKRITFLGLTRYQKLSYRLTLLKYKYNRYTFSLVSNGYNYTAVLRWGEMYF